MCGSYQPPTTDPLKGEKDSRRAVRRFQSKSDYYTFINIDMGLLDFPSIIRQYLIDFRTSINLNGLKEYQHFGDKNENPFREIVEHDS